jgi:hypothetical protein
MRSADSISRPIRTRRTPAWALLMAFAAVASPSAAQSDGDASEVPDPATAGPAGEPVELEAPSTTTTGAYMPSFVPAPGTNLDAHLPSSSQSKADINQPDTFDLRRSTSPSGGSALRGNPDSLGVLSADTAAGMTPGKGFHIVRKGDTLWGITGEHFEDSRDWPRVWSYNPQLQNPHWIYPGDQLRLGQAVAADATTGGIRGGTLGRGVVGRTSLVPPETVFLRELGYIDDPDKDVWGQVVGSLEERQMLGDENHIYMILRPGVDVKVGQQLTIFKPSREPIAPDGARQPPGKLVAFKGTVKIESWDPEHRVAKGEVIEALDAVERGASVGPVGRRHYVVPPAASQVDLRARVLTGMYPHVIMGKDQVLFIDRGENDGLQPGNRLFVVRRGDVWRRTLATTTAMASTRVLVDVPDDVAFEATPIEGDDETFPEEVVGELRVIRAHKYSSLALVTESSEEIEPGDQLVARKGF